MSIITQFAALRAYGRSVFSSAGAIEASDNTWRPITDSLNYMPIVQVLGSIQRKRSGVCGEAEKSWKCIY